MATAAASFPKAKTSIGLVVYIGFEQPKDAVDLTIQRVFFELYGIPVGNMHFFVPDSIKTQLSQGQSSTPKFYEPKDYAATIPTLNHELLIVVAAGHGAAYGITFEHSSAGTALSGILSPHDFISPFKGNKNVKTCILVLGACYAGAFNFLDTKGFGFDLCVIGATAMHSSLNYIVEANLFGNVFLYYFAQWFHPNTKRDIDGDGQSSVMDCFKFASVCTSELLLKSRKGWHKEISGYQVGLSNLMLTDAEKRYLQDEIQNRTGLIHTHQEPWCLNANLMRQIVF